MLFFASHWPGSSMLDAVGIVMHAGKRQVACLVAWLNPLSEPSVSDGAIEALLKEASLRGAKEVSVASGTFLTGTLPDEEQDLQN